MRTLAYLDAGGPQKTFDADSEVGERKTLLSPVGVWSSRCLSVPEPSGRVNLQLCLRRLQGEGGGEAQLVTLFQHPQGC